ncbi:T9SS type A sorting domain-containing protein [Owenweeksia hongkongensis]|uniref:T9SS type A sorting domain-containing protein n=1 Tax=Owenweeksia hongkongensis TaxID=253245 RepID=UPI003A8DE132
MKYLFSVLTIVLTFGVKAQSFNEILFDRGESNNCAVSIAMDQSIYFSNRVSDYFLGVAKKDILYKADQNVHLEDSLDLASYYGFDSFTLANISPESDSSFLIIGQGYTTTPYTEALVVTSLDKDLNVLKTYTSGPVNDSAVYGFSAVWADSLLIIGGLQYLPTITPAYCVFNRQGSIIKQEALDTISGRCIINSVFYKDSSVYMGFWASSDALLMKLDFTDFSIDTLVLRSTSGAPMYHYSLSGFFSFDQAAPTFYAYGEYRNRYLGLFKFDTDLNRLEIDTFASVPNPSSLAQATKAFPGVLDAKDEQYIFFATGEGAYLAPIQLKAGLITNMKLWRVDTGGNEIWSVVVNDSCYYLPTRTLATNDGGVIFFSMKYDWRKDVAPKTDLSIIKLDSNGNFVGLHEMAIPYQKPLAVSAYPNPTVDEITLSGVELRDLAAILVYTIDGILVKEVVNPQSLTISMEDVSSGTYVIHTLYKNGRQGMGKVVKEN